ncbi:transient receptor potential cation channel subfamily V member 5-like isoform X2 [Mercenaria mercenaria]|uniref:transient receptor potential cation channel subfamily V member 5-like isoform X2 n=1 Tax=Mercenaria mercenaria TaxID=6596 RepID=UPI00234E6E5B|nr:transient receptor potential cation channel subfamily V member 5-like isoform X2 [Mercenaria mercenaria]
MGNTAVVASGVKNQADNKAKALYQLVDLKGGGELIECAKRAGWTKDYRELDQKILTEVPKFLYNNGEGKKIPIVDLVMMRNKERQKTKIKAGKEKQEKAKELAKIDMHLTDAEGNYLHNKPDRKYRELCWKIDELGTVGESALHLCLLNSSAIHANLAKRLLHHFPKLINDIYLSEEYYGENALHMAIVIEDPCMVKFLLDKGADYHQRCYGNFFTPDDQKDSRTDSMDHEWVDVCQKTNYEGHVYFGEYPLSFAACLGQEECVRLLVAKGADPNLQDSNGNTVMHMLVIMDRKCSLAEGAMEMFDILYSLGGRLDIRNRQGLTPLTLAAKLARKEMYEHILEIIRQIYWIYGNVTCAGYPLPDVDTISASGELDKFSVLNLVVYGESEGHLDMMDGLIVNLLKEKWKVFARFRFYRRFVIFIIYFLLFVAAFILRPGTDRCPATRQVNSSNGMLQNVTEIDAGYLLKACSTEDKVRFALEVLVLFGAIVYLGLAMKEIYHQGFNIFFTTLRGAPTKAMFLMSCVFVVMMLPGRAAAAYQYEDVMGVLAILFTAPYFLFFCRGVRIVGPFVIMIYKMIKGDLRRFFIIYLVFIVGFSQAFYISFVGSSCDPDTDPCVFANPVDALLGTFSMSVGDFEDIVQTFPSSRHQVTLSIVFVLYMIMVTLLLVNMLIAMMGNTYQLVAETQKEWFRQWAKIVLVVEQSVTTKERQKYQIRYSQPALDGRRAFPIRWYQSEREKEERRVAREEQRRKQKEKMSQSRWKKMKKTAMFTKTINLKEVKEGRLNV